MDYQIEIRHLRYFLMLASTLNYHRAAEKLFISQPGLSRQIRQMENILETKLFYRDRKQVSLTPAGMYLKEEAEILINRLNRVYRHTRDIGIGLEGEVRIGFLGSAMQEVIPKLLVDLKEHHPGINSSLEELSNRAQIQMLLEERLDLGFVRLSGVPTELEVLPVHTDTFSLVVPSGHPALQKGSVGIKSFKDEPFILFREEYSPQYFQTVNSIFQDAGFRPKVSHKSVHAQTIFKLVANGLGLAIVPTSLQSGFTMAVKFIELKDIPQRAILYAVWKKLHQNRALDHCLNLLSRGRTTDI